MVKGGRLHGGATVLKLGDRPSTGVSATPISPAVRAKRTAARPPNGWLGSLVFGSRTDLPATGSVPLVAF